MAITINRTVVAEQKPYTSSFITATFLDRIGIICGIGFVLLLITAGNMVSDPPVDSYEIMAEFYKKNNAGFLKSVYVQALGFMCLIIFVSFLSNLTHRYSKGNGWLPVAIMGSGFMAAVLMVFSQACQGATALMAVRDANPELIRAMDEIAHIVAHLFSAPLGVFLLCTSAAIWLYGIAPKWISVLSILSGTTLISAAGTFDSKELMHGLSVLALLIFLLWTLIFCCSMLWRTRKGRG